MTKLFWINFGLLLLNSFATALVKLLRLDFEMELFRDAGFSDIATITLGVAQLCGAIALSVPRTRQLGAGVMTITYVIATGAVFSAGLYPFAVFSLLFIAMAAWPWARPFGPRPISAT